MEILFCVQTFDLLESSYTGLFERLSVEKASRSITRFKTPVSRYVTDALLGHLLRLCSGEAVFLKVSHVCHIF